MAYFVAIALYMVCFAVLLFVNLILVANGLNWWWIIHCFFSHCYLYAMQFQMVFPHTLSTHCICVTWNTIIFVFDCMIFLVATVAAGTATAVACYICINLKSDGCLLFSKAYLFWIYHIMPMPVQIIQYIPHRMFAMSMYITIRI